VKEDIERIRQSDMGFPELEMLEAYKKAPVITVGEQCTQPVSYTHLTLPTSDLV